MRVYTEKVGWFRYYFIMPATRAGKAVQRLYRRIADRITHRWYCAGCGAYHSGRVVAYYPCDVCDGVCFRHIKPQEILKCESILMGGKNVTYTVKQHFAEGEQVEPEPEEEPPTAEEARAAGQIVKKFCDRRTADTACKHCPLRDMCEAPPYAWKK